ncbi:MAG: tRNA glutamyl-Q(34) synthetase GluQRS [Gammaproteobacteria bacterium]|nr:tRNA glutamyl-Q(34) synthetase GluQRS [Gammaproteobacteria bacterium]
MKNTPYRGRFAPSPTGPLHFGSLMTAMGSYLAARSQNGQWLLRMEDLDPPREIAGAADDILHTLEAHHLHWDGPVFYQSQRLSAYDDALAQLAREGHSFPCRCTRKAIAEQRSTRSSQAAHFDACREGLPEGIATRTVRVRSGDTPIHIDDILHGPQEPYPSREVGDFIVRRADGLHAYHLAAVVDDAHQGITEIVRGADLLDCTPPQVHLQQLLGLQHPRYCHLPIAVNSRGEKLSKQTHAPAIARQTPGPNLYQALCFLGQMPNPALANEPPDTILRWAVAHWNVNNINKHNQVVA